jgi:hypothetical protein
MRRYSHRCCESRFISVIARCCLTGQKDKKAIEQDKKQLLDVAYQDKRTKKAIEQDKKQLLDVA